MIYSTTLHSFIIVLAVALVPSSAFQFTTPLTQAYNNVHYVKEYKYHKIGNGKKGLQSTTTDNSSSSLSNDEISRYSRHLVLGDVGMKGQQDLKNASVLVIGAGGLGSPCLMYLAAAGVGHIGIVVSTGIL